MLFAWEFSNARQVRGIIAAINQGLQEHDWTRADLEKMEALIGQLEPLSPEQAASARRNLYQRYADALIEAARQEQNGPDDFARIEKDRVEILQPRARDLADTVSQAMTKHVLAAVNAPFGQRGIDRRHTSMTSTGSSPPSSHSTSPAPTRPGSTSIAALTVCFSRDWTPTTH